MAVELTKAPAQNPANPLKYAAGLSAVWQKCMSEVYGPEFRLLIGREHGQLKTLKESLGMKRATEMVEYAIRNWGKFAQKAADNVGSGTLPAKPHIGWLSKYHATALMMLEHESQSIAKEKAFQAQVASTKAQWLETVKADESPRATQVPKEQPATIEEIETIMAELGLEKGSNREL